MTSEEDGDFLVIDDAEEEAAATGPSRAERRAEKRAARDARKAGRPAAAPADGMAGAGDASADGAILDAAVLDEVVEAATLSTSLSGEERFAWSLSGLDCPDCAMKASRAVNRLDGVLTCSVNASDGRVQVTVDAARAELHRVESVLRGLGHSADVGWREIPGLTWREVEERWHTDRRGARRLVLRMPGVLAADAGGHGEVLIQLPPQRSLTVQQALDEGLEELSGRPVRLRAIDEQRLRPDQRKLLGGLVALIALVIVWPGELLGWTPWLTGPIAVLGVLVGGWPLLMQAGASLRSRQIGFQVLIGLAVIGAVAIGHWEEALLVVLLDALASHMEASALVHAREAMQGGLDRLPSLARRLRDPSNHGAASISLPSAALDGLSISPMATHSAGPMLDGHGLSAATATSEEIPVALLDPGERVEVRSGEVVPVDGIVVEGVGSIDRGPLTGESIPVRLEAGDEVEAGLTLRQGPLIIETTATGEETRLWGLVQAARVWRERPPRMQVTMESFTVFWVPLVLFGALAVGIATGEILLMLLLWVVACPCALLLAAPVPHAVALSRAGETGLVVRGGEVLERSAAVDLVILDKTGTLTRGEPRLHQIITAPGGTEEGALRMAAGLEQRSSHPYAGVVLGALAERQFAASKVHDQHDGTAGVTGTLQGRELIFGRRDWLESQGVELHPRLVAALDGAAVDGFGASVLASAGVARAVFLFKHDDVRPGTKELIDRLHAARIRVELLSGDIGAAVDDLARGLGIPPELAQGDMSPEQKERWLRERSKRHVTLMAGDGFNDAGALAAADVGVAVDSGEQVNLDSADVLQPSDDPRRLADLIMLARQTRRVVRQNVLFSVAITLTLVAGVIWGWQTNLAVGVLVHELSALFVVINALRIAERGTAGRVLLGLVAELANDVLDSIRLGLDSAPWAQARRARDGATPSPDA